MSSSSIYCSQGHENAVDNRFCRLCGELLTNQLEVGTPVSPSAPDPYKGILVGQRYRLQRQLGHGGFGRTYLAEDTNRFHELCVLKEFAPQVSDPEVLKKAEQLFEREAGVLYQLRHPQIPCFRELLRAEMEGTLPDPLTQHIRLFLVQDYVEGHTYQDLLEQRQQTGQGFSEAEILDLLQRLLPVLAYIHDKGVIHRDISPDNLMQRDSDGLPMLIDFGGVKQAAISAVSGVNSLSERGTASVTIVGKQGYAPHEQMVSGQVSPHSDFYALAVTILVLITGQAPQHLLDPNSPGFWETQLELSPLLTRVLRKMLAPYPSDRYSSAADILAVLFPVSQPQAAPSNSSDPLAVASSAPVQTVAVAPIAPPVSAKSPSPSPANSNSSPANSNSSPANSNSSPASSNASPTQTISSSPSSSPATPSPPSHHFPANPQRTHHFPARRQQKSAFSSPLLVLGLMLLLGGVSAWVGYSLLPQWFANSSQPSDTTDVVPDNGDELAPSLEFSQAEQERKANLRSRRDRLGVNERFLVQLTDASFYQQYPRQRGRALTTEPKDETWRERWDTIAAQWLDQLETLFDQDIRSRLGRYGKADRDQWRKIVNGMNVSSNALYDLTDAQFFSTFPDRQDQDILNQPIGQLWHGMAAQQLVAMQAGETLETIQFAPGAYQSILKRRLQPGSGHIYLLSAEAGQIMRLNLNAPKTLLSLYIPRPSNAIPLLLEDSDQQTWSGALPQSGYYEIVVILNHPELNNRASKKAATVEMTVAVDNVLTPETSNDNDRNDLD